jgi:hypothetical protein
VGILSRSVGFPPLPQGRFGFIVDLFVLDIMLNYQIPEHPSITGVHFVFIVSSKRVYPSIGSQDQGYQFVKETC